MHRAFKKPKTMNQLSLYLKRKIVPVPVSKKYKNG